MGEIMLYSSDDLEASDDLSFLSISNFFIKQTLEFDFVLF